MTAKLSRPLRHSSEHVSVGAVYAIEISDADDRRVPLGRKLLEAAEYLHQISNSNLRPSWASRTFGGRRRLVCSCARSWDICTKKARRGLSLSTIWRDSSSEECVGCGRRRSASRKSTSKS